VVPNERKGNNPMVPYSKAKKVKSPTGRPSKVKPAVKAFMKGKKTAGKRPKRPKAPPKKPGSYLGKAKAAIKRRTNRRIP
jgi:hypothetical protein